MRIPACTTTGDLTADLTAALHAAQHGDEAGFVAVYRDVQPRLLRYATVLVGRDDAEDVTAEAWLQISRDLHRFTGDVDRFRGWAATIVHHRAMDVCRAAARRPTDRIAGRRAGRARRGLGHRGVALDALSTDLALTLIAALPREQAQAVLLRAVVGLDARTAGEVLGKRPARSGSPPTAGSSGSPDRFATTPRKAGGPLSDPRHRRGSNGNRRPGAARHEMHTRRSAGCPAPPPSDCSTAATARPRSPSSSPQRRRPPPQQSCGARPPHARRSGRRCTRPRSPPTSLGEPPCASHRRS